MALIVCITFSFRAEYTVRKNIAVKDAEVRASIVRNMSIQKIASFPPVTEVTESKEKQQAYEDAFLDQMNQYIKFGEVESKYSSCIFIKTPKPLSLTGEQACNQIKML